MQEEAERPDDHDERRSQFLIIRFLLHRHTNSIVLVWCPKQQVRCDIVASLLPTFGKVVNFQDRWTCADASSPALNSWGGMMAIYQNPSYAEAAAKGIPVRCRYIKTLLLHQLIKWISDYEITLPESEGVELNIASLRKLKDKYIFPLEMDLRALGEVTSLIYPDDTRAMSGSHKTVRCQVKYKYAAQAYFAKFILDGKRFKKAGILSTHITPNERAEQVFNKMLNCISKHLEEAFFPDRR